MWSWTWTWCEQPGLVQDILSVQLHRILPAIVSCSIVCAMSTSDNVVWTSALLLDLQWLVDYISIKRRLDQDPFGHLYIYIYVYIVYIVYIYICILYYIHTYLFASLHCCSLFTDETSDQLQLRIAPHSSTEDSTSEGGHFWNINRSSSDSTVRWFNTNS